MVFNPSIACFKMLAQTSVILDWMVSFDKGTDSSAFFLLCHILFQPFLKHIILLRFLQSCVVSFVWQYGKQPCMMLRQKVFAL